jgi:2-dehydropantoate 2-reductase
MRYVVVGPGGVGGYFGGRLAAAGEDVAFLARGAHLAAMQQHGLRIESPQGNAQVRVRATDNASELGQADVVLLTMKLYDLEPSLPQIRPLIGPGTVVVPFQNGVDSVALLSRVFEPTQVAGGTAHITATVVEPGLIRHTALDTLIFGMPGNVPSAPLEALRDAGSRAGFDAVLSDRIEVEIWKKFVRLTVFSGMTSLCRSPIGPIRQHPALRAMMGAAWRESIAVARAAGVALPDDMFEQMQATIDTLPAAARSSMLGDLERGRRLELPWLSGAMVRIAREAGVATPTHQLFVDVLSLHVDGHPSAA